MKSLKKNFLKHCSENKLQINENQKEIIDLLNNFYDSCFKKHFFSNFLKKKSVILGFYLFGDVGVGKTMLLDFFYNNLNIQKQRLHFNEFMINFHNFTHNHKEINKGNPIEFFVKELKKIVN